MTTPISFSPFLGWVDTTDPSNIPADVRIIGAADLLRYEVFGQDAAARINDLITTDAADPTTFAPITGSSAYAVKTVETSKEDAITAGTTGQYWRGDKTWQTLDKTAAGLGSVDDTADTAKPVSVLQAAADALLAKGRVYKNDVATSSGPVSDAIISNIATFTFKAGRSYRIVWDASYYQSVAGDLFWWSIGLAAVTDTPADTANITVLNGRTKGVGSSGTGVTQHSGPVTAYYEPTVDTTQQVKFHVTRVLGTGTVVVVGQGGETAAYRIYDDGAQP
jgi:hypothetical protein